MMTTESLEEEMEENQDYLSSLEMININDSKCDVIISDTFPFLGVDGHKYILSSVINESLLNNNYEYMSVDAVISSLSRAYRFRNRENYFQTRDNWIALGVDRLMVASNWVLWIERKARDNDDQTDLDFFLAGRAIERLIAEASSDEQ